MKIACMANMNNNMFCLVRYLRDRGYDAQLFLVEEFAHFLPECDSYDNDFKQYTHQLDWYETGYWKISPEKIKKDLEGYDFFIGSDLIPAFLNKSGMKLDVFIPHGGDIFVHGYYKFEGLIPKRWEIGAFARARAQRKGIIESKYVLFEYTNEDIEHFLDKMKIKGKRIVSNALYIYLPQYKKENFQKQEVYKTAMDIRAKYDFIVFHQCRHVWRPIREELQYKGNDLLIKSYAAFVKKNPDSKCLLILFEYGWDFNESKDMVKELGIEDKVLWLPRMLRKDIMVWLSIADLCVGELGRSFLAYGSVYEDLALKKPFIGYRRDELYLKFHSTLYPMVSTNSVDTLIHTFEDFAGNKGKYEKMGIEAHEWLVKNAVEKPLNHIISAITEKAPRA